MASADSSSFVVASDIHGNVKQCGKIFTYAETHGHGIILAGDLLPKNRYDAAPRQAAFIQDYLFCVLEIFRRRSGGAPVMLLLGNDDHKTCAPLLASAQRRLGFSYIHRRIITSGGLYIAGYSYVPPTPFTLKDWEAEDGARIAVDRGPHKTSGYHSWPVYNDVLLPMGEYVGIDIKKRGTIARDLRVMFKGFNDFSRMIFVSHAPPYGTALDLGGRDPYRPGMSAMHIGSQAIREFIEDNKPLVTLHGHIHETVTRSGGQWKDRVCAETLSCATGNDPLTDSPQVVVLRITKGRAAAQRLAL